MNQYLITDNKNFKYIYHNFNDGLFHNTKPVWIRVFEPLQGYRNIAYYQVYKAIEPVKKGAMPWSANNIALNKYSDITELSHAIKIAEEV
jgi:hypothetical protein